MAITREEIEQIAEAVAKRVVTRKEVCSCGYNAWVTAHFSEKLHQSLESRDLLRVESELHDFDKHIDSIAKACHVNLNAARDLVGKISKSAGEGIWPQAWISLAEAIKSIDDILREVATEGKS